MAETTPRRRPAASSARGRTTRNTKDGDRVLVDLGNNQLVQMTERAQKKTKLSAVAPKKSAKGRYLRGARGTKSITLQFGKITTVRGKRSTKGKLFQIPVPGDAKIEDYIKIARKAQATAFITPDGVRYPVTSSRSR